MNKESKTKIYFEDEDNEGILIDESNVMDEAEHLYDGDDTIPDEDESIE